MYLKKDIIEYDLKEFLQLTSDLLFDGIGVYNLGTLEITEEDKKHIKECIDMRKNINVDRGVTKHFQYYRDPSKEVDEKGMTGERMVAKLMHYLHGNNPNSGAVLTTPPIAEWVLDKTKQDFIIETNLDWTTFDVKGQYSGAEWFNVNLRAFNRMKLQSQFFLACIIDTPNKKFAEAKSFTLYFVSIDNFEKNSQSVMTSRMPNFTPYRKVPIKYFTE